jgi:glutathione S-transferase|nr:glutathione S-transferase family protein [Gammaproteobacteria bacterium]
MLKIFIANGSISLAPLILLEEVGAQYEAMLIDLSRDEQRQDAYLEINPKGRVPSLVTEDGILTETCAILVYIAHRFGSEDLASMGDPFLFGRIQEFNSYLASTVHVAHAHRLRGTRWVSDQAALEAMQKKVPEVMTQAVTLVEDALLQGPWVMGDTYTICDPYLFTISRWLEDDGVDTGKLPRILEHRRSMMARAATQRALSQMN